MWTAELPPFIIFYAGVLFALIPSHRLRAFAMLLVPVIGAINLLSMSTDASLQVTLAGFELTPLRVDDLTLLFGYAFHIAAFIAILYAFHIRDRVQQVAGLIYAGSALGAVFSGDLLTLFIFWELLAFSSVFLIWARGTERAFVAGLRYLIIQASSGLILLLGIVFYWRAEGTLSFDFIGTDSTYGWIILLALGIKCAFPMFHNWLTDAYPEATPTGTVFLSAFTTKTAVYLLARSYPGTEQLIYIGAFMTCFPIFYAVIENDLRRVLAYSMINQIGFMVCGIGIGTALAVNGAVAHAFNDIVFKGLLFMAMGAVLQMTGKINGSELGGLYKSMPKTTVLCIVGAASISAFPLFSGFVSKSMIMSAALEEGYDWIWLALLFASAGVFHHAGIKIPYFAFFAHDSGIRTTEPPNNMLAAMSISALICIAIGVNPTLLYNLLPYELGYTPYDATHVLAQTQLLFYSALAFVWLNLMRLYPPELPSVNLDVEWLYRKLIPGTGRLLERSVTQATAPTRNLVNNLSGNLDVRATLAKVGETPPSGQMVTWVMILLGAGLIISFW
ncbi:MAG: multicomponent Na+:H+ antiporter subunit D [Candidatus Azotimanducaceae bacterium]|jgi:multicomponent Na+:H+ antiporter subunit D